jgi:hypothetical protein
MDREEKGDITRELKPINIINLPLDIENKPDEYFSKEEDNLSTALALLDIKTEC